MIAKQSVFTNLERDAAFPEGHENARLLLVRQGQEISESELEKYEGATDLAETEAKQKEQPLIPPPNLKQHGQEETGGKIPDPKIKNAPVDQEQGKPAAPAAAPQKATPPVIGKTPKPSKPAKAKRGPEARK